MPRCPHCDQDIELLSPHDLDDKYGISANALQHAREKDKFPKPWLEFRNRNVWLNADIARYSDELARQRVSKKLEELSRLPEAERKAIIAGLS